jgi:hypothetical protein
MPLDLVSIAEKLGVPALTLAGGWVSAVLGFSARLKAAEAKIKEIDEERAHRGRDAEEERARLRKEVADLLAAFKVEIKQQIDELDHGYDELRTSAHDYAKDAELARFVVEVREQWGRMERAVGRIEGALGIISGQKQLPP